MHQCPLPADFRARAARPWLEALDRQWQTLRPDERQAMQCSISEMEDYPEMSDAAKQLEVVDLIQELRIDRCKARVQELVLPLLSNVPPAVHRNALTTFLGGFADLTLTDDQVLDRGMKMMNALKQNFAPGPPPGEGPAEAEHSGEARRSAPVEYGPRQDSDSTVSSASQRSVLLYGGGPPTGPPADPRPATSRGLRAQSLYADASSSLHPLLPLRRYTAGHAFEPTTRGAALERWHESTAANVHRIAITAPSKLEQSDTISHSMDSTETPATPAEDLLVEATSMAHAALPKERTGPPVMPPATPAGDTDTAAGREVPVAPGAAQEPQPALQHRNPDPLESRDNGAGDDSTDSLSVSSSSSSMAFRTDSLQDTMSSEPKGGVGSHRTSSAQLCSQMVEVMKGEVHEYDSLAEMAATIATDADIDGPGPAPEAMSVAAVGEGLDVADASAEKLEQLIPETRLCEGECAVLPTLEVELAAPATSDADNQPPPVADDAALPSEPGPSGDAPAVADDGEGVAAPGAAPQGKEAAVGSAAAAGGEGDGQFGGSAAPDAAADRGRPPPPPEGDAAVAPGGDIRIVVQAPSELPDCLAAGSDPDPASLEDEAATPHDAGCPSTSSSSHEPVVLDGPSATAAVREAADQPAEANNVDMGEGGSLADPPVATVDAKEANTKLKSVETVENDVEREEVPGDPPPDHVSTAGSAGGREVEGCQQPAGEDTGTAPDPATDAGTDRGGGMDAAAVAEAGDAPVAEEAKASEESTDDGNGHAANGEGPPQAGRSEAGSGGAAESEGPAVLQRDTADPVAPGPAMAAEERAEAEAADVPFIGAGAGDVDGRPGAGEAGETTAREAPAPPPNEAALPSADRTSENSTTDGSASSAASAAGPVAEGEDRPAEVAPDRQDCDPRGEEGRAAGPPAAAAEDAGGGDAVAGSSLTGSTEDGESDGYSSVEAGGTETTGDGPAATHEEEEAADHTAATDAEDGGSDPEDPAAAALGDGPQGPGPHVDAEPARLTEGGGSGAENEATVIDQEAEGDQPPEGVLALMEDLLDSEVKMVIAPDVNNLAGPPADVAPAIDAPEKESVAEGEEDAEEEEDEDSAEESAEESVEEGKEEGGSERTSGASSLRQHSEDPEPAGGDSPEEPGRQPAEAPAVAAGEGPAPAVEAGRPVQGTVAPPVAVPVVALVVGIPVDDDTRPPHPGVVVGVPARDALNSSPSRSQSSRGSYAVEGSDAVVVGVPAAGVQTEAVVIGVPASSPPHSGPVLGIPFQPTSGHGPGMDSSSPLWSDITGSFGAPDSSSDSPLAAVLEPYAGGHGGRVVADTPVAASAQAANGFAAASETMAPEAEVQEGEGQQLPTQPIPPDPVTSAPPLDDDTPGSDVPNPTPQTVGADLSDPVAWVDVAVTGADAAETGVGEAKKGGDVAAVEAVALAGALLAEATTPLAEEAEQHLGTPGHDPQPAPDAGDEARGPEVRLENSLPPDAEGGAGTLLGPELAHAATGSPRPEERDGAAPPLAPDEAAPAATPCQPSPSEAPPSDPAPADADADADADPATATIAEGFAALPAPAGLEPPAPSAAQISASPSGSLVTMVMLEEAIAGEIVCKGEMPTTASSEGLVGAVGPAPLEGSSQGSGTRRQSRPAQLELQENKEPKEGTNVSKNTSAQRSTPKKTEARPAKPPFVTGMGRKGRAKEPKEQVKDGVQSPSTERDPSQVDSNVGSKRRVSQRHAELAKETDRLRRLRAASQERSLGADRLPKAEGERRRRPPPQASASSVAAAPQAAAPSPDADTAADRQAVRQDIDQAPLQSMGTSASPAGLQLERGDQLHQRCHNSVPVPSPFGDRPQSGRQAGTPAALHCKADISSWSRLASAPSHRVGRARRLWMERLTGFHPMADCPITSGLPQTETRPTSVEELWQSDLLCGVGRHSEPSPGQAVATGSQQHNILAARRRHNRNLIGQMVDRFGQRQQMLNGLYQDLLPSRTPSTCQTHQDQSNLEL